MIHHQRTLTINATPDKVWKILGNFMQIDEFAPLVKSVDALTEGADGIGSKRRCHFDDGNSVVEEVTVWKPNSRYRVQLSEMDPMPLKEAWAELSIKPVGGSQTQVIWSMAYKVKYGPFGWLLGQTMMKMMMGKVLDGNLKGLAEKVLSNSRSQAQSA